MCEEVEDREHYEYGCKEIEELRRRVAVIAGRQPPQFSREEWALEADVEGGTKLLIVAARWIYHCERCKIDLGKRRRMTLKIVMQKLHRRLILVIIVQRQPVVWLESQRACCLMPFCQQTAARFKMLCLGKCFH